MQVNLNGAFCSAKEERMRPEDVFQAEEADVSTESHFPHAIRVEIKLILDNLHEMLYLSRKEGINKTHLNLSHT